MLNTKFFFQIFLYIDKNLLDHIVIILFINSLHYFKRLFNMKMRFDKYNLTHYVIVISIFQSIFSIFVVLLLYYIKLFFR